MTQQAASHKKLYIDLHVNELPFHVYWYIPSAEMSEVTTVAMAVLSRFPRISTHTSTLPFSSGKEICGSTNPISAPV